MNKIKLEKDNGITLTGASKQMFGGVEFIINNTKIIGYELNRINDEILELEFSNNLSKNNLTTQWFWPQRNGQITLRDVLLNVCGSFCSQYEIHNYNLEVADLYKQRWIITATPIREIPPFVEPAFYKSLKRAITWREFLSNEISIQSVKTIHDTGYRFTPYNN